MVCVDTQVGKLDAMHPRDPERREMLATLLYVLQDAPELLLREMWKDVSRVREGVCRCVCVLGLAVVVIFVCAWRVVACCFVSVGVGGLWR